MQDFLDKAIELEALKFGSFKLKSGMESDYFFNIAAFFDSESLSFLADCYVTKILDLNIDFDLFFGPAYKGIPLASVVATKYFEATKQKGKRIMFFPTSYLICLPLDVGFPHF